MSTKRDFWIDNVKIYACILVVLGHFFQSMVLSEIINQSFMSSWFDQTIYYFHVPLFFICSGFLYQKFSYVSDFVSWKTNILKKLLNLGVPYFVFSTLTWVMKVIFSGSVNNKVDGFFTSIFLKPISPFWYLYALFFLFLITPTFKNKKNLLIALTISFFLKIISFLPFDSNIYAIDTVLNNEIWFVIGMCLGFFEFPKSLNIKKTSVFSVFVSLVFLCLSFVLSLKNINTEWISFILGLMGCFVTIIIIVACDRFAFFQRIAEICSQYTLPVFLLHTLCAATWRSILLKIGIDSAFIHIFTGLIISFAGPIIIAKIMMKLKWLEFIIYPNKYVKLKNKGV